MSLALRLSEGLGLAAEKPTDDVLILFVEARTDILKPCLLHDSGRGLIVWCHFGQYLSCSRRERDANELLERRSCRPSAMCPGRDAVPDFNSAVFR